jgi:hypothetical protein
MEPEGLLPQSQNPPILNLLYLIKHNAKQFLHLSHGVLRMYNQLCTIRTSALHVHVDEWAILGSGPFYVPEKYADAHRARHLWNSEI